MTHLVDGGQPDATDLAALAGFGTATIYEAQGQRGALDAGVKPLSPDMEFVGRAVTVAAAPGDNLVVHHVVAAAVPGDVLVIAAGGYLEAGLWGDVLTEAARARGIVAVVVDGAVRDSVAVRRARFPLFARGLSIKGTGKNQPGRVGGAVVCAGALVNAGDVVVGDADGVVVVPAADLPDVIVRARRRQAEESAWCEALRGGATTIELMGLGDKLVAVGLR